MQNDGGIKRGDRAKTGPLQSRPKPGVGVHGSGLPGGDGGATGHVTAVTDSLAEPIDPEDVDTEDLVVQAEDQEDLHITTADDPNLGLTNVPGHPPEDWAANTGPSRTPEEIEGVAPSPDDRDEKIAPRTKKSAAKKPHRR